MEKIQFDALGEILIGVIIFNYALNELKLDISLIDCLIIILFSISGLIIYFSIKLLACSIAFWTISSGEVMSVVYETNSVSKYPLEIIKNLIVKNILIYIIPFAIVSYLPMIFIIRDMDYINNIFGFSLQSKYYLLGFSFMISFTIFYVSLLIWKLGLRQYTSSGS